MYSRVLSRSFLSCPVVARMWHEHCVVPVPPVRRARVDQTRRPTARWRHTVVVDTNERTDMIGSDLQILARRGEVVPQVRVDRATQVVIVVVWGSARIVELSLATALSTPPCPHRVVEPG